MFIFTASLSYHMWHCTWTLFYFICHCIVFLNTLVFSIPAKLVLNWEFPVMCECRLTLLFSQGYTLISKGLTFFLCRPKWYL